METCLLHANCQGEPLARLLSASREFASRWRLYHYVNYTHESVPAGALAACSLFLYQELGPEWNELASANLLAQLPPHAVVVRLPNLFFKGYWPLWTGASSMNFGDIHLDYLSDQGLNPAEAVHVCLKSDVAALYDLDTLLAESLAVERRREAGSVIELVDYVEAHWREEQLFTTVNHPGPRLLRMVADAVLVRLGLPPLEACRAEELNLSCDRNFELPIYPGVARYFGLPFGGEDRRYPAYGKNLTWREYALCYMDCRSRGLNLLEYLQAVHA